MMSEYQQFIEQDEAHARFQARRETRMRFAYLDYQDGGELKCGACGGRCWHHFNDGSRNDIGECCARRAA